MGGEGLSVRSCSADATTVRRAETRERLRAAEAGRWRAGGTTVGVTLGVLAETLVGAAGESVR